MSRDTSEKRSFLSALLKRAEPVELKSLSDVRDSEKYGAFYSAKPADQIRRERLIALHKVEFDSYTQKVETAYQNFRAGSFGSTASEKARAARSEQNAIAFIDLYQEIYKIDLRTTTDLKDVEKDIKELQDTCSLNNAEEERSSMAFTVARADIAESVPRIIGGIKLRADNLKVESNANITSGPTG